MLPALAVHMLALVHILLVMGLVRYTLATSEWGMQDDRLYTGRIAVDTDNSPGHYCNHYQYIGGDEGAHQPGYTLQRVHTILTPGQRYLHNRVKGQATDTVTCDLRTDSTSSLKIHSLVEAMTIYKNVQHNRQPFKEVFPDFNVDCGENDLTSFGYHQLVSIGEHLHKSYFKHEKHKNLVPKASTVRIESEVSKCAYVSDLAFLHGLLPEKEFSKAKVHKSLKNFCWTESSQVKSCHCPRSAELEAYVQQALVKGRYMYKNSIPYQAKLAEIFGQRVAEKYSFLELYDHFLLASCNQENLVCFQDGEFISITQDSLSALGNMTSQFLQLVAGDATLQQYTYLYTFPFLDRLLWPSVQTDTQQRLFVSMADRQFLQLLSLILGLSIGVTPPASRLVLELYQKAHDQINSGSMYIRVLYNGLDLTGHVTGCDRHMENGLCRIEALQELVRIMGEKYNEDCHT